MFIYDPRWSCTTCKGLFDDNDDDDDDYDDDDFFNRLLISNAKVELYNMQGVTGGTELDK